MERTANEKGLSAIKDLLEKPGIINALAVIYSTNSPGFVIGHIVKSSIGYLAQNAMNKTNSLISYSSKILGERAKQINENLYNTTITR
jgi:hypothetical protein